MVNRMLGFFFPATFAHHFYALHRRLLAIVREDELCRRLMTILVSAVVALTYRATVDVPARFRKSKSIGAAFGLTCLRVSIGRDYGAAEYHAAAMR
jgi:transposase